MGPRFVILFLLLSCACWGEPLARGYRLLEAGDWKQARQLFTEVPGEEGELARAQVALVLGEAERVADELLGESVPLRITRLQALCDSKQYTRARTLLKSLEKLKHGKFPHPYDFRFYLYRGLVERRNHHYKLAEKNYREAQRRARSVAQKVRASDALTALWLGAGDLEKAKSSFAQSAKLVGDIESVWVLADHLDVNSDLEYDLGQQATAATLNRASRELYRAHGNISKAADMMLARLYLADLANAPQTSLEIKKSALAEYLQCQDYAGVVRCLDLLRNHYYDSSATPEALNSLFLGAVEQLPPGPWRQRAQLVQANFLVNQSRSSEEVQRVLKQPLQSSDPRVKCQAHRVLAGQFREKGQFDEARRELERALALASPHMAADRDWKCAPGSTLITLSNLEKNRHNYSQALELARRAIAAQPEEDWRYWRVDSRYQSLMSAMETYDLAEARIEFESSLSDMEGLRHAHQRAGRLTTILAALALNQSVDDDVLDPAQLLLGEYNEVAENLLGEVFSDSETLNRNLAIFDSWHQTTIAKKQTFTEPFALLYKGLFLEALGRLAEARTTLDSALKTARAGKVKPAQMLTLIMLARIDLREGRPEKAVDSLTEASGIARQVNPLAARFYLLVAGSAQRDVGRLQEAKNSFDLAIASKPEQAWAALYGRALTLEKMGQPQEALRDVAQALEQLKGRELPASSAVLKARRAHILDTLGESAQAAPLFAQARETLMEIGAAQELAKVAQDSARCLIRLDRAGEALTLLTSTIDTLSEWHALSYRQAGPLFEQTVALALGEGQAQTALRYLQMSHSAELLDSVQLSEVKTGDPDTEKLLAEVRQLKLRLGKLREQSGGATDQVARDSFGQLLAVTREQFFTKMNELKNKEPDFEALVQFTGSQLSAVQELLSPESALIEYFPSQNQLYIFVVTRQNFSLHQVSITRPELAKLVSDFLTVASHAGQPSYKALAQKLHRLLIQSTGDSLKGYRRLRVVPSGPLWEVPFNVLADGRGNSLNQRFEISYLSSSDLMKITRNRPPNHPKEALLVSGSALSGANAEIRELKRMLPESQVMKGGQLNLETFAQQVPRRDVIHIASHSNVGAQSYVELGQDRLELEQIYGLKLKPGSLVVLSSCRSAVSNETPGKEVTSLATAFSIAGASTVVASRWEVDDQSTSEFFKLFYQAVMARKTRGEALRFAEREIAKRHPHPYYWAGFSLLGDPR